MIISSLRPFDDGRMDRGTGLGTTDDFNSILFYQIESGAINGRKGRGLKIKEPTPTVMYLK